jgi:signal transduction histidine kinase
VTTMAPVRVVLADDTPDFRLLMRVLLERDGRFEVVGEAGDGAAAVEVAASVQPDLVLLDMAMPVMDGLQAIPRIRLDAPATAILCLSGFNRESLAEEALRLGAHGYLEKGRPVEEVIAESLRVCSAGLEVAAVVTGADGDDLAEIAGTPPPASGPGPDLGSLVGLLRRPVARITELTSALPGIAGDPPLHEAALAELEQAADSVRAVIEGIAELAASDPSCLQLDAADTDVAALVRRVTDRARPSAPGHRLHAVAPPELVAAIDPARTRRMLRLLVDNAIVHTPPGTVVVVVATQVGGIVELSVSDDGPGIPSGQRFRIFDPFVRLDPDTPGTGIGLTMARALARAHGGELTAMTAPGGGARFVARLPVRSG